MEKSIPLAREEVLDLTGDFGRAYDVLTSSSKNYFATGKAGTGKSTLLRHFVDQTAVMTNYSGHYMKECLMDLASRLLLMEKEEVCRGSKIHMKDANIHLLCDFAKWNVLYRWYRPCLGDLIIS